MPPRDILPSLRQAFGAVDLDGHHACTFAGPHGHEVNMQFHPDEQILRLATPIGSPRTDAKRALLVAGLLSNTAFAAHTPFHLAFDPGAQRLMQCLSIATPGLEAAALLQAVQLLVDTAAQHRQHLHQEGVLDAS